MSLPHRFAAPRVLSLFAVLLLAAALVAAGGRAADAGASDLLDVDVAEATGDVLAIVHPADDVSLADAVAGALDAGLLVAGEFPNVGVFGATGAVSAFNALAGTGLIERVEANHQLRLFTDSSHTATRGQAVLDGAVNGTPYDGSGVGVAVVDSGHDGTHPDLSANTASNVKIIFPTTAAVPFPDTDTISGGGHGTHVSGIVMGDGSASNGQYHGAAPGASLYGISAGTAISVHSALGGLEWVLANHDQVSPAIKVVNNSWGSAAGDYNPGDAISIAVGNLIDEGVTVVFAAGNDGGNGSAQATSPTCVDPTPGLICVASYDDQGTGTRTGTVSTFSSRGRSGQVNTYPDVSAPGTDITSTCRLTLPICATGSQVFSPLNTYSVLSGTSMAAPHIAGIAAQLYQANPGLTPAQVEDILEDTALQFTDGAAYEADPSNPTTTTSVDKGHGLVDVVAAVTEALAR
ncbi:putative secreted peptidase [Euzebya pacifica]|uniref:Putative secreted peptidase n=1 Tax=Euzebya pacifica TaxID=1608957 RepID=A0A346XV70_9ACTN|nr:S8 family serine peptidase [Euzebya pacifica]AXV06117.1 putative secreted peptidase [Euzebya pacifica]